MYKKNKVHTSNNQITRLFQKREKMLKSLESAKSYLKSENPSPTPMESFISS